MNGLLYKEEADAEQGCEHGDPNQCTFCQACGHCVEDLDDDQFCYDCNNAMSGVDVEESEYCHLPEAMALEGGYSFD